MVISGRIALLMLSVVTAALAIVMWFAQDLAPWLALVVAACALMSIVLLNVFHLPTASGGPREPSRIDALTDQRRRELVRGTSLYLRELHYRYSIRSDPGESSEHRCFTAEVNTIKLGFVPVVIIDNTTDRQGYGFVAFVHDGKRWRGPGLPCPFGQVEAVRHAAKCVSPLSTDEETSF